MLCHSASLAGRSIGPRFWPNAPASPWQRTRRVDLGRVVKPRLDHCLGAWKVLIDQLIGRCLFGELEKLHERRFGRWPMQVCIRLKQTRHGLKGRQCIEVRVAALRIRGEHNDRRRAPRIPRLPRFHVAHVTAMTLQRWKVWELWIEGRQNRPGTRFEGETRRQRSERPSGSSNRDKIIAEVSKAVTRQIPSARRFAGVPNTRQE